VSQQKVATLVERYADKIRGVLSCNDRVVISGTIPEICHAQAMASHLTAQKIRLFDYSRWAEPFRETIRENAERVATDNGLEIEFIRRKNDFRKEARVKAIVAERGDHPGLVHIFSAMEPCPSFKPWHDKTTHKTFLKSTQAKCLHYYFYFIDEELGLCYLRVPTWAPFRLQFYFNGHNELARRLEKKKIPYTMLDNAFVEIEDFDRAQKLADSFRVAGLHRRLDRMARTFCPVIRQFHSGYHWSLMQTEYATDIVFKHREDLRVLYEALVRTAVHTVKAEQVAMFLGRKLHGNYLDELGSDFHTRIQGTRIKHHMGKVAIKMYDKHGLILRIETVANDVGFFKHHREVEQRDGTRPFKLAPVKKTIYSLSILRELMGASNRRYLDFLSTLDDPTDGAKNLDNVSRPVRKGERTFRGFNLFHGDDLAVFTALLRGEFNISGLTCRRLRAVLKNKSGSQVSRILRRLRMHGLIRKIGHTYKYYLTRLGRRVLLAALHLRQTLLIPTLGGTLPAEC
jgi:hypothetical protein